MKRSIREIVCVVVIGFAALSPAAAQVAAAPSIPTVVATVNGEAISGAEWLDRTQSVTVNDFQTPRSRTMSAGQLALDTLITERLVTQYAAKVGLSPSDAEVNADVEARKANPEIRARLESRQISDAQLRKAVRYAHTLQNFVSINQSVSEDETRAWFDAYYGNRWQIAILRTATRASADAAQAEIARGVGFAAVVAKYSDDPETKKADGLLMGTDGKPRWLTQRDFTAFPSFVGTSVMKLAKIGDATPVLEQTAPDGRRAFYIIRLAGMHHATDDEYKKMRPQARQEALMARAAQSGTADRKLAEVRKESKITIALPGYESLAHEPGG